MSNVIETYQDKCIGCGACVRVCPSPEANILKMAEDGRIVTEINNEKCIACGECVKVCKSRARDYDDDTEKFFKELKDRKIVVIAHPAIKSAFPGTWQAVLKWFKQNGADGVYDGAYGADICTWAYVRAIEGGTCKNVLSQTCPAVVKYMELYHPDVCREIAPVQSMLSCEAVYIRDYLKKNYAVAALTPCPAMKLEFEETGHVEYNITFKRLKEYFRRKKIDFNKSVSNDQHYDFDDQVQGAMGGIFPNPGGLRYNLTINMPSVIAVNSDGVENVYKELDAFAEMPPSRHPDVFEALSCSGGCGCGCGVGPVDTDQNILDIRNIWREVEIDARSRRKVAMNGTDKMFKTFDDRINPRSLRRDYESKSKPAPALSIKELEEIFVQLGKNDEYSRKIDCGGCGYNSCAAFAEAVYYKRNIPSSCVMCKNAAVIPAPAPAPAAEAAPAVDNSKAEEIANKVSVFATNLTADIENIYASLYNIDNSNQQSASMSKIVEDILSKVVGFCSSNDSIDSENLPLLVSTLEKLQTAVASLNSNVVACANDSATIREAMQEVADATTELNVMAHDMVSTFADKY